MLFVVLCPGTPEGFFFGFPWVETSTAGRVYDLCVLLYDGSTRRLTESGFMWFFMVLWRSRESNLRPLVYKA